MSLVDRLAEKWKAHIQSPDEPSDYRKDPVFWLNVIADELEKDDPDRWHFAAKWLRSQASDGGDDG